MRLAILKIICVDIYVDSFFILFIFSITYFGTKGKKKTKKFI